MPYILSPLITSNSAGMWQEGPAYEAENIYKIRKNSFPPVNYDKHILKPHSLTHLETPAHTQIDGKRIEYFYKSHLNFFYGPTLVIKLDGNKYSETSNTLIKHWIITKEELKSRIEFVSPSFIPPKILITSNYCPLNSDGYHDPNFVLTLSQDAANYLISIQGFHLYGTSWKSTDYNPGEVSRPIHNTIFSKGIILENLKLSDVPEGIYFMNAFPLPLVDASESPVVPVLFTETEISFR
jgi:arylformamidase